MNFVLLSSGIHAHTSDLFPGMKVKGAITCVTRNADMFVDEEEVEDLLKALKGQLHGRNFGETFAKSQPLSQRVRDKFLAAQYYLDDEDIFRVDGLVNTHRLDLG